MSDEIRYVISHSRRRIELAAFTDWLDDAYWTQWQTREQIYKALQNSIVIGAFALTSNGRTKPAGVARFITDHSTNSFLTDLYVAESHRRRGVGRLLMQAVTQHNSVRPTLCILGCREHLRHFYNEFGFTGVGGDFMVRNPTP